MAVPGGSGHRFGDLGQAAEGLAVPSETLVVNSDGSIDILFGPSEPGEKSNWIRTVPGKGFFDVQVLRTRGTLLRQDVET